jgi:hypothetical protein
MGFVSCGGDDNDNPENFVWGGDWNDPNDPNYKPEGYNPIQGDWVNVDDISDMLSFSSDRVMYGLTLKPNGKYEVVINLGKYEINNKAFRYGPEGFMAQLYKIENNVLSIKLVLKEGDEQEWKRYARHEK